MRIEELICGPTGQLRHPLRRLGTRCVATCDLDCYLSEVGVKREFLGMETHPAQ